MIGNKDNIDSRKFIKEWRVIIACYNIKFYNSTVQLQFDESNPWGAGVCLNWNITIKYVSTVPQIWKK